MRIPAFFRTTKGQIISAVIAFLLVMGVFVLLISALMGNSDVPGSEEAGSTTNTSTSDGQGGGDIQSDIRQILDSVSSTRNLKGLTLRINQVDVCRVPDLTAYVAVSSDSGDISQLTGKDVKAYVDGKEVKSPRFERVDTNKQPLSATLVIDRSGSMRGAPIDQAKLAASQFVDNSAVNDKIAVVQFGETASTLLTLSSDKQAVKNAVAGIGVQGNTALYDAIAQGVRETSGCSRRAVVVLSDGGDTASKNASLDSAINAANVAGIPAFVVGLQGSTYDSNTLRSIAERTGGQLFETADPNGLKELYAKVDQQLKGQYYIGLNLDVQKTGGEHRLKVVSNVQGSPTESERSFIY